MRVERPNWEESAPPTILVGVQTYNPLATLRMELFWSTVESLDRAFPKAHIFEIVHNGSDDDSPDAIGRDARGGELRRWGETQVAAEPGASTAPGAGRNWLLHALLDVLPSSVDRNNLLVVTSDDDMLWKEGAEEQLLRMWRYAPPDVAVIGGLLEPLYDWNTPRAVLEAPDGSRCLVRDSCPGAAFTFWTGCPFWDVSRERVRRRDYFEEKFGYDYDFCCKLKEQGYRVAQMDLAEHIGWGASTHGNDAVNDRNTKALDRDKWGI